MPVPIRQPSHEVVETVLRRVRDEGIRFVNLQFTDVVGMVKSVTIPADKLEDAIDHGKWFDGSSIEGFARIAESDMFLVPDLDTFAPIPWDRSSDQTARIICWVYNPSGDLFPGDPRAVLLRALEERARSASLHTGPELEFFLLRPDDQGRIAPAAPRPGRLLRLLDPTSPNDVRQGDDERPRGDGDPRRDEPPRGRGRPARDRLRVRRRAALGRQLGDLSSTRSRRSRRSTACTRPSCPSPCSGRNGLRACTSTRA